MNRTRSIQPIHPLRTLAAALCLTAFALGTLFAGAAPAAAQPPAGPIPPAEGTPHGIPVGPGLYRLHGSHPDLPTDDLGPLHFIVGNADFVGLGETVHTVGGFYEMKHRLFRYLVEEKGFRALGLETPWIAAEAARQYVATCDGSSLAAVRSTFAVWQSTELQAVLEWMCEWNTQHPGDPVHFYGFDIQNSGDTSVWVALDFVEDLDPAAAAGIHRCDGVDRFYFPFEPYPEENFQACLAGLDAAEALLDGKEVRHAFSRDALAELGIHLVTARAWQGQLFYFFDDIVRSYAFRDRGMATVARAYRDLHFPGARTALWAHNGHINKNGAEASNGLTTMGTFLDEELGHKYVSIALAAHDTYLEWPWAGRCGGPADLFGPNPVEPLLAATGESHLLLDLDPRGALPTFLEEGVDHWIAGIGGDLPRHWDALVYMESAWAMDPLFSFAPCP